MNRNQIYQNRKETSDLDIYMGSLAPLGQRSSQSKLDESTTNAYIILIPLQTTTFYEAFIISWCVFDPCDSRMAALDRL